jgi:hypothetical protein
MKYIIILLSLFISLQGISQIDLTYRKGSSRFDSILYDGHYIGHIMYGTLYHENYKGTYSIYINSLWIYISEGVPIVTNSSIVGEFYNQVIKDRNLDRGSFMSHDIGSYIQEKVMLNKEDVSYLSGVFIKKSAKNKLASKAVRVSGAVVGGVLAFVTLPVSIAVIGVSSFVSFCIDVESDKKLRTAGELIEKLN